MRCCCLLSCQGEEGDKIAATAIANPDQFVLKPQREGGGRSCRGVLVWLRAQAWSCFGHWDRSWC